MSGFNPKAVDEAFFPDGRHRVNFLLNIGYGDRGALHPRPPRLDVAEVASWGDTHLQAMGLGAYIAKATEAGDFPRVVLGITVMCILVTLFNRLLWRPLYAFGERRLRLG